MLTETVRIPSHYFDGVSGFFHSNHRLHPAVHSPCTLRLSEHLTLSPTLTPVHQLFPQNVTVSTKIPWLVIRITDPTHILHSTMPVLLFAFNLFHFLSLLVIYLPVSE